MYVAGQPNIQDNYQTGYWEWDMTGQVPFSNPALLRALGYSETELATDPDWQVKVPDSDKQQFLISLQNHVKSRGQVVFAQEVRFLNLHGKTEYFLFTGKVIKWNVYNEPLSMRIIYINITAQKEAEKEILRLKDFLDKTTQVAMVGGWELDMATEQVTWSGVTRQIFGVPESFVPERTSATTFFKEGFDRDSLKQAFVEAVTEGKTYDLELRIINTRGEERWTRTIGQPEFKNGKCVRLNGIFQDITNHKQDQERLATKNQQLEKFINAAPVSIAMFDREMRYMAASHIWMASYKLDVTTIIGKSHYDVFFEIPDVWREYLKRGLAGEVIKIEEDSFIRRDGKQEWLRWEIRPWFEAPGVVGGIIMFTELITERKLVKEELIRARDLAEEAVLAKSRFLSVMSHEIRTPMNAVIGFTNLLLNDPRPDQLEYLKPLKFSADNLMVIINDILSLSKAEEGKIELENVAFDLGELIQNIYATNKPFTNDKRLSFIVNYDSRVPGLIIGDPVRLGQIITNLVNNAIKFTATGKITIVVKVLREDSGMVELNFAVKDSGIGIPGDKQAYIFQLFTQASSETTRQYGGTGLGLAICQRLAELMGGKITVQSEPGEGSVFSFTLMFPKGRPAMAKETAVDAKKLTGTLKGLSILITEDNPLNVMLLKRYLQQWGAECDVAENGEIALTMVKLKNYNLVLMDVQMPVMDGYETTRAIRNLPEQRYADMPIIALTANVLADVRETILASGMNDGLSKPFNVNELYEMINRIKNRIF
ncbi:ATP-binding protein [Mucilaginibacter glaciei]|uniref:histidine kinase n=1 Tax=Mucilaginibacter glaciei TaxID=2772109 RepID=A0A926S800_9SPHI|nr:ATP-binding protein [Mucilaginibacter glaciei]MBD1395231.1 response regulator [Mucilaginibacter glaciei]